MTSTGTLSSVRPPLNIGSLCPFVSRSSFHACHCPAAEGPLWDRQGFETGGREGTWGYIWPSQYYGLWRCRIEPGSRRTGGAKVAVLRDCGEVGGRGWIWGMPERGMVVLVMACFGTRGGAGRGMGLVHVLTALGWWAEGGSRGFVVVRHSKVVTMNYMRLCPLWAVEENVRGHM